nr:cyclase family protein [Streptosporangium album]
MHEPWEAVAGARVFDLAQPKGFAALGIDAFVPYVGRAVLLDIAAVRGVAALPPGYEITTEDLDEAADGLDIGPGEAVLIGTGWSRHWAEPDLFTGQSGGAPGPGAVAGRRLADHRPRLVGAETIAFEHIAAGHGHAALPYTGSSSSRKGSTSSIPCAWPSSSTPASASFCSS